MVSCLTHSIDRCNSQRGPVRPQRAGGSGPSAGTRRRAQQAATDPRRGTTDRVRTGRHVPLPTTGVDDHGATDNGGPYERRANGATGASTRPRRAGSARAGGRAGPARTRWASRHRDRSDGRLPMPMLRVSPGSRPGVKPGGQDRSHAGTTRTRRADTVMTPPESWPARGR